MTAAPRPAPVAMPVKRSTTTVQRLRVCVYLPGGALAETTLTARLVRVGRKA